MIKLCSPIKEKPKINVVVTDILYLQLTKEMLHEHLFYSPFSTTILEIVNIKKKEIFYYEHCLEN